MRVKLTRIRELLQKVYRRRWVPVIADPGNRPDFSVRVYHELRRSGISARYRVAGLGGGPATPVGSVGQNILVEVQKGDLHRAREIIDALGR